MSVAKIHFEEETPTVVEVTFLTTVFFSSPIPKEAHIYVDRHLPFGSCVLLPNMNKVKHSQYST